MTEFGGGGDLGGDLGSSTDFGSSDLGSTDFGSSDLGSTDLGSTDLGSTDLGSTDLGSTDLGSTDLGSTDLGSTDPLGGLTSPTFAPDPAVPSFTTDPLGTTDLGTTDFGTTGLGTTTTDPFAFTAPTAPAPTTVAPTVGDDPLAGLGLTAPTFSTDPAVPSFTTTTGADGFSITPAAATAVVDTATGLTSDTGTLGQGLASLALAPTSFGTFGAPVATEQTALQSGWGDAFSSLTGGLTTLFGNVGTAIGNYVDGDAAVAAGFGGTTTAAPPSPTVPPQDQPLPPGGWDSMRTSDLYTPFLLDGAAADFALHGWWNAAGLVDHYLGGTGTDYQVDPARMMSDIPTFQSQVDAAVAEHAGQPSWQTDWQNTNTDLRDDQGTYVGQQSSDWYWGLHDFRYRVYGTTDPGTGQGSYTVEVYKPYVFGSPRSDITIPSGVPFLGGTKIPQDDLQHLHDTGRAADFVVRGSATFPH